MPKIDIDAVAVRDRLVYPEPHRSVTMGYEQRRVGDAAELTQFGVNRVVLAPDAHTALRHWHEIQDEFVIVVAGEVVLIEDDAETILRAGDCAGFKSGVAKGHAFRNRSDGPVILFEIGIRAEDETVHYPDLDLRYEKRDTSRTFLHRDGTPY